MTTVPRSLAAVILLVFTTSSIEAQVATTPPPGPGVPTGTVRLRAAPANGARGVEVRLRWQMDVGWLPDGGFNVYRSDRPQPLNEAPLAAAAAAAATVAITPQRTVALGSLLGSAAQVPAGVDGRALKIAVPRIPRPPSAAAQFNARKSSVAAQVLARGPQFIAKATPTATTLAPPAPTTLAPPSALPAAPLRALAAPVDKTLEARRQLTMAAALHGDVARAAGLAFDDTGVAEGATYTYTLRMIVAGKETGDVASVTVTVGSDRAPPPPAGLDARQMGIDTVELRWARLTVQQEDALGVARYDVVRSGPGTAPAQRLNKLPVLVSDTAEATVEREAFFSDGAAPIGAVTYHLTLTDTFGRTSAPAALQFQVADWHRPDPVGAVWAGLDQRERIDPFLQRSVTVAWLPVKGSGLAYRIYRVATENRPLYEPYVVTPQPITGTRIPPDAPRTPLRDLIVNAQLTRVAARTAPLELLNAITRDLVQELAARHVDWDVAKLPAAQNDAVSRRVLSTVPVLYAVDRTPAVDRHYVYSVAALYTRNQLESTTMQSPLVPVPDSRPPAPIANARSEFKTVDQMRATGAAPATSPLIRPDIPLPTTTVSAASGALAPRELPRVPPPGWGGSVLLTWDAAPTGTRTRYMVYRANASRFLRPAPVQMPTSTTSTSSAPVTSPTGTLTMTPVTVPLTIARTLPLSGLAASTPPDSAFKLIETVDRPRFRDDMPRSSAHYYAYRIIPVSNWGVRGQKLDLPVRVPATLPPTVPTLRRAWPDATGSVQVQFEHNPVTEEVVRFEVLRKTIFTQQDAPLVAPLQPLQPIVTVARPRVQLGGVDLTSHGPIADRIGASATRFGIVSRSSAASALARDPVLAARVAEFSDFGQKVGEAHPTQLQWTDLRQNVSWRSEYLYRLVAVNSDGLRSEPSKPLSARPLKVLPDPPGNLTAAYDPQSGAVQVSWTRSDPATAGYILERGIVSPTGQLGDMLQLTGILPTSAAVALAKHADYSAFAGPRYVYRVRALDQAGNVSDPACSWGACGTIPPDIRAVTVAQ